MTDHAATAPARLATRLAFFAAGFATACWAPIIPFAKANVGADEAAFGILLLCLGLGSVIAMPVTGFVSTRFGARSMMLLGGFGLSAFLPVLALAQGAVPLGAALFVFGASLGTLDVAMNIHGAEIERREGRPLMSGFHAQWSVGTFAGSGLMTGVLTLGLAPVPAALIGAALTLGAMLLARPRFLRAKGDAPEPFALPRGIVLLIAVLTGIAFLVEGAILDWGALLLIDRDLMGAESAGAGFMLFSVAMVVGRLTGDRVVAALGMVRVLFWGGALTVLGLAVILLAPGTATALLGFILVGLGAANVVPVLFSLAGRQKVMPPGLAIAAITTVGYAGILLGPALVGFAAAATSLPAAFWVLVALMALIPACAVRAGRI